MWKSELVEDLTKRNSMVLITQYGEIEVDIRDAEKLWIVDPSIVFQTEFRIAGSASRIEDYLFKIGTEKDVIKSCKRDVITFESYKSDGRISDLFNLELSKFSISDKLSNSKETKEKACDEEQAVSKGKTRGRKLIPLDKRIKQLPIGKHLDVSALQESGSGAIVIKLGPRVKKYGHPNLPLVSNNLETYLLAIDMLGGEEEYKVEVDYVKKLFLNDTSRDKRSSDDENSSEDSVSPNLKSSLIVSTNNSKLSNSVAKINLFQNIIQNKSQTDCHKENTNDNDSSSDNTLPNVPMQTLMPMHPKNAKFEPTSNLINPATAVQIPTGKLPILIPGKSIKKVQTPIKILAK